MSSPRTGILSLIRFDGLCDFGVTPVPIGLGFWTGLGLGLGLRVPDLGLGEVS